MSNNPLSILTLSDIRRNLPNSLTHMLGDDVMVLQIDGDILERSLSTFRTSIDPLRFNGYCSLYCIRGDFLVDVNLKTYKMGPRSLLVNFPGNIIRLHGIQMEKLKDYFVVAILMTSEFLHNIRFDFNKTFQNSVRIMEWPVVTLNDQQEPIAADYVNLIRKILQSRLTHQREIIGALISSLTYMAVDLWKSGLPESVEEAPEVKTDRLSALFDRFIALVGENCVSQRTVQFYADRLNLTPKYLSKLIKQSSGRSAPDWINSFVILDAKNQLRFSDSSIKEIVYRLNFPNQAVFYKFFKTHTGMTPSAYRKAIAR